jgi:hypothetical protein
MPAARPESEREHRHGSESPLRKSTQVVDFPLMTVEFSALKLRTDDFERGNSEGSLANTSI